MCSGSLFKNFLGSYVCGEKVSVSTKGLSICFCEIFLDRLSVLAHITDIAVQGHNGDTEKYVTKYFVQWSNDFNFWHHMSDEVSNIWL